MEKLNEILGNIKEVSFNSQVDLQGNYFAACMYKTQKVDDWDKYDELFMPEVYANREAYAEVSFFFEAQDGKSTQASIALYLELSDTEVVIDPDFVSITDENDHLVWQGKFLDLPKEWRLFVDTLDADIALEEELLERV